MEGVTVTSKGQVTLPSRLRKRLGIRPGDRLLFVADGPGARLFVLRRRPLAELFGCLKLAEPALGKAELRSRLAEYLAGRHLRS